MSKLDAYNLLLLLIDEIRSQMSLFWWEILSFLQTLSGAGKAVLIE